MSGVSDDSPAKRAGLQAGDIIAHFGDQPVEAEKDEDLPSFQRQVAAISPGGKVSLGLLRDGKSKRTTVVLASQPTVVPDERETELGFHVQEITERLFREQRLDSRKGAYVSFVARGSPAAEAGLIRGDVVESIEGVSVGSLGDFEKGIAKAESRDRFLITARRGGDLKFLLVKRGDKPSRQVPGAGSEATAAPSEPGPGD